MHTSSIDPGQIRAAAALIRSRVRRTPVLEVAGEDFGLPGIVIVFKQEYLQHAGSFKTRGAFTQMLRRSIPPAGVVAASGGNHGAATAFAAMKQGVPATIFVPSVASPAKLRQIRSYGAALRIEGDRYADALAASLAWAQRTGAAQVHAFDQVETLLGQGTVALEFEEQAPGLDAVLVAVGGGGLIGGMAAWYAGRTQLVGVEPEAAPTLTRALAAGQPVDAPTGGVAADSLAPRRVGDLMFPIAQRHVARTVLVSDEAIGHAQRELWRTLRVVAEPGGATALAALLEGRFRPPEGSRIGVLLCGANTDAVRFECQAEEQAA
ncbi:threonine/serine dehydratase [Ramlibacter pallidus]|uniref:Threonine/serine dehydratase n=1 Tax=Ramlibacter pallidus TaxID=2780087 RepID=A0ABR9S607_9BURK|nr:threonine/serine dehydratase [Ramlibacter pallidus]MBE7368951.1 threonine/serine dehydratase [Ramlibacter pallidus]